MPGLASSSATTWSGHIQRHLIPLSEQPKPPEPHEAVAFGTLPTPHMLTAKFSPDSGWQDPQIVPYAPLAMPPDSVAFHYGQQIFEGLKAYRGTDQQIYLFRPDRNARRFFRSAERLAMAPVPEDMFLACVRALVATEAQWVLPPPWSRYIRPFLIPLDRGVSLRASRSYLFVVIVTPVSAYYANPDGVVVTIERNLVRAAPGGVGEAKCGGNYAASLLPLARARASGAEQVLWLDALEHTYVEEVGAMNIMFVYGKRILTPKLVGSILPGVTRDSVLKLAPRLGYTIEETRVPISQVLADIRSGAMTECFGCGTAAVISPISAMLDGDEHYALPPLPSSGVAQSLKQALSEIQLGLADDPFDWRQAVPLE